MQKRPEKPLQNRWELVPPASSLVPGVVHPPHAQGPPSLIGLCPPVSPTVKGTATAQPRCPSLPPPALPEQARATWPGVGAEKALPRTCLILAKAQGGGSGPDLRMNRGAPGPRLTPSTHPTALPGLLPQGLRCAGHFLLLTGHWLPAAQPGWPHASLLTDIWALPRCCWCPRVLQKEGHRTRVWLRSERPGAFRAHRAGSDPRHLPG